MLTRSDLSRFLVVTLALVCGPTLLGAQDADVRADAQKQIVELRKHVRDQRQQADNRPALKVAWGKVLDAVEGIKLGEDHTLAGVEPLKKALDSVGSAIDKLPVRDQAIATGLKKARNLLDDLVELAKQARKAAERSGDKAQDAAATVVAEVSQLRDELATLSEAERRKLFEALGQGVIAPLKNSIQRAHELSAEKLAKMRAAADKIREAEKSLLVQIDAVQRALNAPGMPRRVTEEVLLPLARGEITEGEGWKRLQKLAGGALDTLARLAEQRNFWTITINGVGSAAAILGGELTMPLFAPGFAFGALRNRDDYNFAYVWSGCGKAGLTLEAAAGIQVGVWKSKPEDLSGAFVGLTAGLSYVVGGNVSAAFHPSTGDWLGFSGTGSVGVGWWGEFAVIGGYTLAIPPKKVIDRIRERRQEQ